MASQSLLFLLFPSERWPSKIYITLPFCCCLYVCPIASAEPSGSPQRQPEIYYTSDRLLTLSVC